MCSSDLKLTQLLIPEEMIRGHSGIKIFAAERNVLCFLEIEPVPIAYFHLRLLTEQHSRLVAVAVHNFDFTVSLDDEYINNIEKKEK